ncbi:hypothetical protein SESBI_22691 [Sesbania bispinosa]|nr:hypothetical protein SESBI_22691 [Sesbania bispinosa]
MAGKPPPPPEETHLRDRRRSNDMVHPLETTVTVSHLPPGAAIPVQYYNGGVKHYRNWFAWLIPLFVVANIVMFIITMYVNNCPKNSFSCIARFLGRFSFQPFKENPLLGPSSLTLQKVGALDVNRVVHRHQGWRLISCMWLHGGVFHLVANMLGILFIGIRLEQEFGFDLLSVDLLNGLWPTFIQRRSWREGGPPKVQITGIDFPQPGFRPAERVIETGCRLAAYAEAFNLPFEYNAIAKKWETIQLEELNIDRDEFLVVTSCEGYERVEMPETYKQWQTRILWAGFLQPPFDHDTMKMAMEKARTGYYKDFVIDDNSQWLLQVELQCLLGCYLSYLDLGGSLLSALFIQSNISVGASGALFGLLGGMLSELITNWSIYESKVGALFTLVIIIGVNLALGILPHVDNFAHIGGFLTGFLLGFVFFIRPQFGWVNQRYAPLEYSPTRAKRKFKKYQCILWVLSLIILIVGLSVGLVALLRGVDANDHCSWCHYLSCVPTSKWSCHTEAAYCETTQLGNQLNVTCSSNGKSNTYYMQDPSSSQIQQLCTQLCR